MAKPRNLKFLSGTIETFPPETVAHVTRVVAGRVVDLVEEDERPAICAELLDALGLVSSDSHLESFAPVADINMDSIKGYMPKARSTSSKTHQTRR